MVGVKRSGADGELSEFMRRLTVTHAMRWHAHRGSAGSGHVYQNRFKSFPCERDEHLLILLRPLFLNGRQWLASSRKRR